MAKVVVIGASRGIGFQIAKQYCEAGDEVLACCRNPKGAAELNKLADASDGRLTIHAVDLEDPSTFEALAKGLGDQAVDILINNAGDVGGGHQAVDDIDYEAWMRTLRLNALAPFQICKALKENLKKGQGKIMNVSSQLAASTWPMGGMYGYSTSKAALNKITQNLAIDWKDDGLIVACCHPGWVRTDMGGPNADIEPEESAEGIRSVIAGLKPEDSGKFFKWNGEIHPW
jgi:NAD(P)-dependent dehydrogenase (short-subunit alcohol dehydrogenase family)